LFTPSLKSEKDELGFVHPLNKKKSEKDVLKKKKLLALCLSICMGPQHNKKNATI
jgi:hypothetical protein